MINAPDELPVRLDLRALGFHRRWLGKDQNVFVDVFEQEVRRVRITAEDRPLCVRRTPPAASPVFRPDDFVDHYEAKLSQKNGEISCQRKRQKAHIGVLINICGDETQLPAWHQYAITFAPHISRRFNELGVTLDRSKVVRSGAVVSLSLGKMRPSACRRGEDGVSSLSIKRASSTRKFSRTVDQISSGEVDGALVARIS